MIDRGRDERACKQIMGQTCFSKSKATGGFSIYDRILTVIFRYFDVELLFVAWLN